MGLFFPHRFRIIAGGSLLLYERLGIWWSPSLDIRGTQLPTLWRSGVLVKGETAGEGRRSLQNEGMLPAALPSGGIVLDDVVRFLTPTDFHRLTATFKTGRKWNIESENCNAASAPDYKLHLLKVTWAVVREVRHGYKRILKKLTGSRPLVSINMKHSLEKIHKFLLVFDFRPCVFIGQMAGWSHLSENEMSVNLNSSLKGNSGIFKPRPYFWHEIRSSTHREQFGESRRPSEDI